MKESQRNRIFSWLASRYPQEQNIKLVGMKEIQGNRTFRWLASRRSTGTGHSAGWSAGDPEEQE